MKGERGLKKKGMKEFVEAMSVTAPCSESWWPVDNMGIHTCQNSLIQILKYLCIVCKSHLNKIRVLKGKQTSLEDECPSLAGLAASLVSWGTGLHRHSPPLAGSLADPPLACGRVQARNRCLWRPTTPTSLSNEPKVFAHLQISKSSENGNNLSWLPLCSVSGALDLRNDCETLTIALCFGGFNFLPGCSGTGLNYIWGFLMKLGGVQRVVPLQESTCQKVLWSVGALLSDSVKPLPGKQEECWAQEQGKK